MIGKKLQHPALGSCVVTKVISRHEVEVSFPDLGIEGERYRLASLIDPVTGREPEHSSTAPVADQEARAVEIPSVEGDILQARLAILALRLGQCPEAYIDEMTVGAKEVKDACTWALDRSHGGNPAVVVFESPFGKGKTHALNLFSSMARRQFRAVGSVVLDGIGITLTEPMTLLSNLAASIRFPNEQGYETLPERLCDLVRTRRVDRLRGNSVSFLADCLDRVPHEIADQPDAWEIVVDYLSCVLPASQAKKLLAPFRDHGGAPSLPAIVANRVGERADRCVTMLREWAQACMVVGAHRGLLVLFDEADVDYGNTGFNSKMVERRSWLYESIRELEASQQRAFLSIGIAVTPGQDNYWGGDAVEEMLEHLGGGCTRHVQLRDLTGEDFIELGKRVASLYGDAYGGEVLSSAEAATFADELSERMSSRINDSCLPRRFIREFIEHLDLAANR
jgi:hypothetical protein